MTTQPKHKRVLHDATPRGLPRWLRAADNAVRNPNSPGAKLYYRRVANAQRMRETYGDGDRVVFYDYRGKRNAVACGLFCASMHAQQAYLQEFRSEQQGTRSYTDHRGVRSEYPRYVQIETPVSLNQLTQFLESSDRTNLLSLSGVVLKRSVKCIVCATPVKSP